MGSVSEIVPDLFLGNRAAATNDGLLIRLGITHVVNISGSPLVYPPGVEALQFGHVRDAPQSGRALHSCFEPACAFIHAALSQPSAEEGWRRNRVLVHCQGGHSRSPSLVCAYLIKQWHMTFEAALMTVRAGRPSANPIPAFVAELRRFERNVVR